MLARSSLRWSKRLRRLRLRLGSKETSLAEKARRSSMRFAGEIELLVFLILASEEGDQRVSSFCKALKYSFLRRAGVTLA